MSLNFFLSGEVMDTMSLGLTGISIGGFWVARAVDVNPCPTTVYHGQ
jgi:hypothetical protein